MPQCFTVFFLAALWLSGSAPVIAQPKLLSVTGIAAPVTSNNSFSHRVAYREQHTISPQQHTVVYTDAQGHTLARKQIHYQHGYTTPEYQLQDIIHHRNSGSAWQDGHFVVYRQEGEQRQSEKVVQPSSNTVIDAGFDYFIRRHWDALIDGKTLPFTLIVADPLTELHMQVAEVSTAQTAIPQHSEHYRYFLVNSSNPLIRWVIPTLHLAYDRDSQLLQVYQGPSNIPDSAGKVQTVNIQYSYTLPPVSASMPPPPQLH